MEETLKIYFNHPSALKFDKMVEEYVTNTGMSPIVNIDIVDEETGEIKIDLEENFNKKVEDAFGQELNDILSDYIIATLRLMQEDFEKSEDSGEI